MMSNAGLPIFGGLNRFLETRCYWYIYRLKVFLLKMFTSSFRKNADGD